MSWFFGDPAPRPEPRRPVTQPRSRAKAMAAELALMQAEDSFLAKKLAGTLTKQDRLDLREQRKEFRLKYRKPVEDGEGASPGTIVVEATVKAVG